MRIKLILALSFISNPAMAMISDIEEAQGQQASISPVATPASPHPTFKVEDVYAGLSEFERAKVKGKRASLSKGFSSPTEMQSLLDELAIQLSATPSAHDNLGDLRCDLLEWVYNTTKETEDFERTSLIGESLLPLLSPRLTGHQRLGLLRILKGEDVSELPSLTTPFRELFKNTPLHDDQYAACFLMMKALPSASRTDDAAQQIVTYFNAPQHLGILKICEDHIAALTQVQDRPLIDILRDANTHITPDMNGFNRKKVLIKVIKGESFEDTTTDN